jgi:hypothetical protein
MVAPLRHRQTKEAETDMFDLQPPRHISTLHKAAVTSRTDFWSGIGAIADVRWGAWQKVFRAGGSVRSPDLPCAVSQPPGIG